MTAFSILILTVLLYGEQMVTEGMLVNSQGGAWSISGSNTGSFQHSWNQCGCVHGSCFVMDIGGSHTETCHCHSGWTGPKCDINSHEVAVSSSGSNTGSFHQSSNQCGCVHGSCSVIDIGGSHTETCYCHSGWTGPKCDIDPCVPNPCNNGGFCERRTNSWPTFSCTCADGFYGDHCQNGHQPTTTKATTTTITTVTPTTKPQTRVDYNTCNKMTTVIQIADEVSVSHTSAHVCSTGSTASPEAMVLVHCAVNGTWSWSRGTNVRDHCSEIPLYTPVAAFPGDGQYNGDTAWSGIFVGCLTDGFRLAHQLCDQPANFTHIVSGGRDNMDPTAYYTIQ